MIELVILDLMETIVGRVNYNIPRNGFSDFMNRNDDKKIVLCTDVSSGEFVDKALGELGVIDRLDGVYTFKDMVEIPEYQRPRKDLKKICSDLRVTPDDVVFISDGIRDLEDARREGIKFIHVPEYKQKEETFSFALIDLNKQLAAYTDLRPVNQVHKKINQEKQ